MIYVRIAIANGSFNLNIMNLKDWKHIKQKTIKKRTYLKIQLTTHVDQAFSEIQHLSNPNMLFDLPTWILLFISLVTFSREQPIYLNVAHAL